MDEWKGREWIGGWERSVKVGRKRWTERAWKGRRLKGWVGKRRRMGIRKKGMKTT